MPLLPPGAGGHAAAGSHAEEAKPPLLSFDPGFGHLVESSSSCCCWCCCVRSRGKPGFSRRSQHREEFIRDALERAKHDREASETQPQEIRGAASSRPGLRPRPSSPRDAACGKSSA